jgi:hypothetical protein
MVEILLFKVRFPALGPIIVLEFRCCKSDSLSSDIPTIFLSPIISIRNGDGEEELHDKLANLPIPAFCIPIYLMGSPYKAPAVQIF